MQRLVGLYTDSKLVLDGVGTLESLQKAQELNVVILPGPFRLSDTTRAKNPLPPEATKWGPGLGWTDDDSELRAAIDRAHSRGVRVWLIAGAWHIGGERFPEFCMKDIYGKPLTDAPQRKHAIEQGIMTFCPTDERFNEWFRSAYLEILRTYEVEGLILTHARYTAPAFFDNLFGCACDRCAGAAEAMGYDFLAMRSAIERFFQAFRKLTPEFFAEVRTSNLSLFDYLELLNSPALLDWFSFRARVISDRLGEFRSHLHNEVGREIVFGSDTFVPSLAFLVGHQYKELTKALDFHSPLLPHVQVFINSTFASWAHYLCVGCPGLRESDALAAIYRLVGYDDLEMPLTIDGLGVSRGVECEWECLPLEKVVAKELRKARLLNPGVIPSLPVIKGGLWPREVVRNLIQLVWDLGFEGILFQQISELLP